MILCRVNKLWKQLDQAVFAKYAFFILNIAEGTKLYNSLKYAEVYLKPF